MPTAPSAEVIAGFQSGYTEVYSRVDIYEADATTLWMSDAPHIDGQVSVDSTRDERRTASLKLDNLNGQLKPQPGGLWYDKVVKIFRGIRYYNVNNVQSFYEIQLGEFTADTIDAESFPKGVINVGLRDSTRKLLQAKFATSTAFSSGNPIETIISAIAQAGGIPVSKISLPATGVNTGKDFLFDRTTERWKAINDIATAYGYDVFFDNTGVLTMAVYSDPSNAGTSPSQFTFEVGGRNQRNGDFSDLAGRRPRAYVKTYASYTAQSPTVGILREMGYTVTWVYNTALPTAQQLYDTDIDLLVLDANAWGVTGGDLDIAYAAYNLGINVFITGNDTTFSAGCPIWTGSTTVTAGQLTPTTPTGTNYLSEGWSSFSDTDNAKYPTGARGSTFAFAQTTYTVDSTQKTTGIAEQSGGVTQGSGGTTAARFVFLQQWLTTADQLLTRRILRWLSNGVALPTWWNFDLIAIPNAAAISLELKNGRSQSPVAVSPNLMGNSSFEVDDPAQTGKPAGGWSGYGTGPNISQLITTDKIHGSKSWRTGSTDTTFRGWVTTIQDGAGLPLNVVSYRGMQLTFSIYVKAITLDAAETFSLTMQGSSGPSAASVNQILPSDVGFWKRIYGTYTVAAGDNTVTVIMACNPGSHAYELYLDSMQIEVGLAPTAYQPTQLDTPPDPIFPAVRIDTKSSAGTPRFWGKAIPVVPNEVYNVSVWTRALLAQAGFYLRVYFGTSDQFTSSVSFTDVFANQAYLTDWTQFLGPVTVPAGISYMRVALIDSNASANSNTAWFADVKVDRILPDGDTKGNLIHYAKKVDSSRIYNHVVVSAESTTTIPVYSQVENNTATSPTRIAKLGRRTYFYTSSFLTTTGQCLTVATNFLQRVALESFEVGIDSILTPWLEPGNIVSFIDPDSVSSDPVRYLLSDITIPVRPGPMQGSLKRVTIVG